ncbi:MAG: sterol desaturase family protein [Bacteroidia bacterium]
MEPQFFFPVIGNLLRYFLFAGAAFLIFYVLFPGKFSVNKIQNRVARRRDFVREILHSMQSSLIIGLVIALFAFTPLRQYTQLYNDVHTFPLWWMPISLLLAMLLHDSWFYWMHRAIHHPVLYKTVHLVHHKSVNPSPWASFSFHFMEALAEAMIVPLIMLLIPVHISTLLLFGLVSFLINVYGHLGYEIAPRWFRHSFLFRILNSSVYHNLHHSRFRGNYSLYFRHWDRLMGTEHPDYVKEYDRIQAQRFQEKNQPIAELR